LNRILVQIHIEADFIGHVVAHKILELSLEGRVLCRVLIVLIVVVDVVSVVGIESVVVLSLVSLIVFLKRGGLVVVVGVLVFANDKVSCVHIEEGILQSVRIALVELGNCVGVV
jgi:hypothetical protein